MIEFLQDYTTTAIPPETFKVGDRVKRSDESELYFVKLGLAAFVGADGLIDADGRKIETTVVGVVASTGEAVIGLDAPQRASTGPGNALLFGDQQTERLRADHQRELAEAIEASDATVAQLHDEYGQKIDGLNVSHGTALADATERVAQLEAELKAANGEGDDLVKRVESLTNELATLRASATDADAVSDPAPGTAPGKRGK